MGPVNDLLIKAEKTGRCYVFENSGVHVSNTPAVLGAMVSDVVIHGHLSAGTAGIESAMLGKPTLLVDREGSPFSKLYNLSKNNVVFKSWEEVIYALSNYFQEGVRNEEFGNWSNFLNLLDPFNDKKGGTRISSYLKNLYDFISEGVDRDSSMELAADQYSKEWGHDKIITYP